MVIALAQAAVSNRATSGALSVSLGSTPVSGNLLVACFAWNGSPTTYAPPSGWNVAKQWNGPSGLAAIWYKVSTGVVGDKDISTTPATGNQYDLHLAEFSGFTTPTLDRTAKGDSSTTTVTTLTSESTGALRAPDELIVACTVHNGTVSAPSWTALTALRTTSRCFSAWGLDTDQSAKTPTVGWTTATRAAMAVATFSPTFINTSFVGWGVPA